MVHQDVRILKIICFILEEDVSILLSYAADKNDIWLGLRKEEVRDC